VKAISLFAGVGGFDLAMQRAGIETVAAVEIDPRCRDVLARNFPETKLFDDVTKVGADDLRATGFDGRNGIITGGFPCQDLSSAGRRAGLAGSRSGLFWEIVRLADELKPQWLILENVPGLLSSNNGRDMGVVVETLAELGYGICWRVLDAQNFGVAQRRRRVFFVCSLGDHVRPVEILFEPESGGGHLATITKKKQDLASRLDSSLDADGRHGDHNQRVAPSLLSRDYKGLNSDDIRDGKYVFGEGYEESDTAKTPLKRYAKSATDSLCAIGFNHTAISDNQARIEQAPTIKATNNTQGAVFSKTVIRRLTPKECERLQGFPDEWTSGQVNSHRYKQMGNAVAVPVVEWIMRRLVACAS
jgi:DNA (cytosine-5)-methyltransferase 1